MLHVPGPPLESSGVAVLVVLVVLDFQRRFAVFRECKLQLIPFEGQVADLITMTRHVDSGSLQETQKNGCFLLDDDLSLVENKRLVICRHQRSPTSHKMVLLSFQFVHVVVCPWSIFWRNSLSKPEGK